MALNVVRNLRQQTLALFARKTTSGRFIPEIDGLRFIAIALVVLFHLSVYVGSKPALRDHVGPVDRGVAAFLGKGANGVELFFIISGFVLALPFAAHYLERGAPVNLRAYYSRRLTRLEPPYILAMIGCFAALVVINRASPSVLLPELSAQLVYLHNWLFPRSAGVNVVAWSLEVEVQFYLLAPFIAALLFRLRNPLRRRALIVALSLVAIAGQALLASAGIHLWISLLSFIQYFLMGFLLADVYLTSWRRRPSQHWSWDIAWVLCWAVLFYVWETQAPVLALLCFPFVAAAMCAATFRSVWVRRCVANPWIATIGGMCYTIYLLHYPLISAIGRFTLPLGEGSHFWVHLILQIVLVVPVVLLLCAAFFLLIERPCMDRNWPRKLVDRTRSVMLTFRLIRPDIHRETTI